VPDDPIRIVAGLGNPGPKYAGTRHNAGQMVVDLLAARLGAGRFATRYAARLADARGPSGPVTLLLPQTYMNESGDSVGPAAGALRAAPSQVLVVHDELDLPFGTVRGKLGGGHGGHNGLRSVARGLGSGDFPRLRLGIGRPPADFRGDGADWVLTRFAEPRAEVDAMVARAADMAEVALAEGMAAAIERFHASEPGARARARNERRAAARPAAGEQADDATGDAGTAGAPPAGR
jgi:peptidyl-tRNA hydrolase, PTH1 family